MTWRIQPQNSGETLDTWAPIPSATVGEEPKEATRYIAGVFRDLVERTPSVREIDGWSAQFQSGSQRSTFLSFLVHSDEFRTLWIRRTYLDVFGRDATIEEIRHWMEFFARGKSHDEALASLLSNAEFTVAYEGRNGEYVRALFRILFSRKAELAEIESWSGLLDAKCATFAGIAIELVRSPEYQERVLREWYWRFFGRAIDRESLDLFGEHFRCGEPSEGVLVRVLDCREYYRRKIR